MSFAPVQVTAMKAESFPVLGFWKDGDSLAPTLAVANVWASPLFESLRSSGLFPSQKGEMLTVPPCADWPKGMVLLHLGTRAERTTEGIGALVRATVAKLRKAPSLLFGATDWFGDDRKVGAGLFAQNVVRALAPKVNYKKDAEVPQCPEVLWLSDINEELSPEYAEIQKEKDGKNIIVLLTKCDLKTPAEIASSIEKTTRQTGNETKTIAISAQTGDGMDELYAALKTAARHPEYENDIVVSNIRHYEALVRARTAMQRVTDGLQTSLPGDLLAQDIREAMHYIGEITGEITPADLLQTIFSRFCIGK